MKGKTAVKRRKIRFAILFAGLTIFSLGFLFVLMRFLMLLVPIANERITLQAQPIVTINNEQETGTEKQTIISEPVFTPISMAFITPSPLSPTAEQPTTNSQQSTINEEPPVTSIAQSPISDLEPPTSASLQPSTPPAPTPTPPPPAQLIIPSLGVSKTLAYIPVENGQWNLENLESGIGHLQTTGEHPGDDVGMTFVGHVTRPWPEIAGPFADLIFMKPGDEIIYRWDGFDYVYGLEGFARVKPEAVEYLYIEDGDVITLATCDTWDYVEWEYADRLLARARLLRKVPTPQEAPMLQ